MIIFSSSSFLCPPLRACASVQANIIRLITISWAILSFSSSVICYNVFSSPKGELATHGMLDSIEGSFCFSSWEGVTGWILFNILDFRLICAIFFVLMLKKISYLKTSFITSIKCLITSEIGIIPFNLWDNIFTPFEFIILSIKTTKSRHKSDFLYWFAEKAAVRNCLSI